MNKPEVPTPPLAAPMPSDQTPDHAARYERLAEAFYNATGKMAPGKDVSAEMGGDDLDERVAMWRVFIAGLNLPTPTPDHGQARSDWPDHEPDAGRTGNPVNWCERCRLEAQSLAAPPQDRVSEAIPLPTDDEAWGLYRSIRRMFPDEQEAITRFARALTAALTAEVEGLREDEARLTQGLAETIVKWLVVKDAELYSR